MNIIFFSCLLFVTTQRIFADENAPTNSSGSEGQEVPSSVKTAVPQPDENSVNLPANTEESKSKFYESASEKKRHSRDSGTTATTEVNTQTKIKSKYTNPQGTQYEVDPD